ncbi:MAG: hypothetical protein HRU13_13230, partial [Phycisphaerales bacterium]|nr:hypothetical protein [Phycisphaerales bacterium]
MRPLLAEPSDDLEDTPPRTGKADVDLARINWNPTVNAMADAQRVEPGSWPWLMGGIAAWSGSSGEQASYGWSHAHKLTPAYIRAVLANYGHRRSYYSGAPFRQWNYAVAGRPHGWKPESPGDQPDGTVVYMTSSGPVKVSGPDAEHLWLTPLFAVFDDPNPIMVDTGLGNRLPSNVVAGFLARMLTSSAVGMVRDYREDGVKPYPWTYGDRATSRLLHTFTEAHKRGLLPQSDMPTVLVWIEDVVLPFYERGPGIHAFGDAEGGLFPMGLFNGLNWVVPAMHDAARVLERDKATKKLAVRLDAIVARFARWAADLEAMK